MITFVDVLLFLWYIGEEAGSGSASGSDSASAYGGGPETNSMYYHLQHTVYYVLIKASPIRTKKFTKGSNSA